MIVSDVRCIAISRGSAGAKCSATCIDCGADRLYQADVVRRATAHMIRRRTLQAATSDRLQRDDLSKHAATAHAGGSIARLTERGINERRPLHQVLHPLGVREGARADPEVFLQAQGDDQLSVREEPDLARASAASMRCAAIPTARSAASPASCARRCARRWRSRSRPSRARTAAAAPRATTST